MLGRILAVIAVIAGLWWAADYNYDMMGARSEEILSQLFDDAQESIEKTPPASISKMYPPLDQSVDSLRVLTLSPARSGLITCRTQATTFSQQPRYRALSYEWGPSDITLPIRINGIDTRVRKNLWYALYNIRHPKEEVVLWIDAICINQQDLREKARLVPQMSTVYQRAEEVLVWLGQITPPDVVRTYLPQIAKWQTPPSKINSSYHTEWWEQAVPWLYQLVLAPYWQRTWVIQEIGEAVKLAVHFGDSSLPWDVFISLVHAFRGCFSYVEETDMIDLMNNLRDSKRNGDIYSLADLVWQFRDSFCKMPQDKLHAFLGMADDDPTSTFTTAYDRSLRDVYSDFVRYLARSAIDTVTKEIQVVQRSAMMRYLLVRRAGKVQNTNGKPCIVHKQDDPYTYHYTVKDSEGKETLKTGVDYRKKWSEWEECTSENEVSCWLSSAPEQSETWTQNHSLSQDRIRARGLLVGQIEHLGPTIEMFLMSAHVVAHVVRQWKLSVIEHFAQMPNQKKMIALCQRMADFLGQMPVESLISSIGSFQSPNDSRPRSPRLFIASNGVLGLASPSAEIGDSIVQFWYSTASAVVKRGVNVDNDENHWEVSGRAGIVREESGYCHDWDASDDMALFEGLEHERSPHNPPILIIDMDIDTLTQMNLNSVQLTKPSPGNKCCPSQEVADKFWLCQSLRDVRGEYLGPSLRWIISGYIAPGLLWFWREVLGPMVVVTFVSFCGVFFRLYWSSKTAAQTGF